MNSIKKIVSKSEIKPMNNSKNKLKLQIIENFNPSQKKQIKGKIWLLWSFGFLI